MLSGWPSYGTHKNWATRLVLKSLKDMSGGILQDITKGASILGMFILAVLVARWVSISLFLMFHLLRMIAYIHWDKLSSGYKGIQEAFAQVGQGHLKPPEKLQLSNKT